MSAGASGAGSAAATAWVELAGAGVSYRRGVETVEAVVDASLTLTAGVITALLGPSGSGKSTLLDVLAGWREPDRGTATRHPDLRPGWRGLGMVPQDLGLLPELTVAENLALPGVVSRQDIGRRADRLLERCGLADLADRPTTMISMGEQQRVAVARSLVLEPQVVIADEPTAHQDEANGALIIDLLAETAANGAAVIVATHDPRVVGRVDRAIEMTDGRLGPVERGPAGAIDV